MTTLSVSLEERVKLLERLVQQREDDLKLVREERDMLEGVNTMSQMAIRKLESDRGTDLPPSQQDALDSISRLEDLLKLEKFRADGALREKRKAETALKAKEKEVERITVELQEIKEQTGWVRGGVVRAPFKDVKFSDNKIQELQGIIQKHQEEEKQFRQTERKQQMTIDALTKEVQQKKKLEEDLVQLKNQLKMKEREMKDLSDELKTLTRITSKKDSQLASADNAKDDAPLRALEGDKKFLQAEITKHLELRRLQERTIKSQAIRVEQLESRMAAITASLKELGMDKVMAEALKARVTSSPQKGADGATEVYRTVSLLGDSVDVEVYALLLKDVEHLRKVLTARDAAIKDRDETIEILRKKVDVLVHMKKTDTRQISKERQDLGTQVEELKRSLEQQQESFRQEMDKLKLENARLKKRAPRDSE